jgi:hypothetical protein
MLQRSHIDLRLYHPETEIDGALVLHPNAEFYTRRLLAILFLGFATTSLWACTIETPWQWEARRVREEARRQAKWEQTEVIGDQPDEPLPDESPPRVVQQWIKKIASQLGIPVEPLRTTTQQVSFSPNGRSLVRQETGTISIPISRAPGKGGRRET